MNRKKTAYPVFTTILFLSAIFLSFLSLQKLNKPSQSEQAKQSITLINNWLLSGSKSIDTQSQMLSEDALRGKNMLRIVYNLHGLCVMNGEASAITIHTKNSDKKYSISLAEYGQNCYDGQQALEIPLSNFNGLNPDRKIQSIEARFWYPTYYNVEIKNAVAYHAKTAVLGESTPQRKTPLLKTFPNISPIRPFPYAASSSSALE